MNKKSIIVLLVLVLALSGLFAKDSGFKVGGQLGWGFDTGIMKDTDANSTVIVKAKNNGFAFNLTGEYDFDKNWGVVANVGMMFAGKSTFVTQHADEDPDTAKTAKRAGLYVDVALDAKYTYSINEKISVAGLAGLEMVSGHLLKGYNEWDEVTAYSDAFEDSELYNVAFGLNLGLEGSYKITDDISVTGGVTGAWFFVNTSKAVKIVTNAWKEDGDTFSVANFYIRPYIGVTYAL